MNVALEPWLIRGKPEEAAQAHKLNGSLSLNQTGKEGHT